MKFKNIKVGMNIQHKKSGKFHEVKERYGAYLEGYIVGYYNDGKFDDRFMILDDEDAKLFRKYKEQK